MSQRAALALLAAVGCGEPASVETPVVTVEPAPIASTPVRATASAKVVAVSDASLRTRMPELGVSVVLPPETTPSFDENRTGYFFRFSDAEQGAIELVASPAPKTEQEAMARWAQASGVRDHRILEHGGGGLEPWWAVSSFQVRMGVEGRPGLHRLQRVTRVEGLLAVEPGKHVKCTMFLEYDVEIGGRAPSLDRAIGICKSLRPL